MARLFKSAIIFILPLLLCSTFADAGLLGDLLGFKPMKNKHRGRKRHKKPIRPVVYDIGFNYEDNNNNDNNYNNYNNHVRREAFYKAKGRGRWMLFTVNAGVSAMHLVINHKNKAIMFDSTIYNPTALSLGVGNCRQVPGAKKGVVDCWAHAAEMDTVTGFVRPLKVLTDPWCAAGGFGRDGTLVQGGGWKDGGRAVRYLRDCKDCDWEEHPVALTGERWYSTQIILPDGEFIIIGGRAMFSYEYIPPPGQNNVKSIPLPFLAQTSDKNENNLYPFAHLAPDGNVFLFANNRAILFDPKTTKVIHRYPILKGGARNYPSSGMSVLLPIDLREEDAGNTPGPIRAEVMVCGGTPANSNELAPKKKFLPALTSCGRISITSRTDFWHMEEMPMPRTMGDMLVLPNTEVLIINGASKGCAGWDFAREPVLTPVLYRPYLEAQGTTDRFVTLRATLIPRMYHSSSAVLQDASILVTGSNTNPRYDFNGVLFPTEVRAEKFYPPYLDEDDFFRPAIQAESVPGVVKYGEVVRLEFTMIQKGFFVDDKDFMVTMYYPPFTTHGFSMNQRLLVLKMEKLRSWFGRARSCKVTMPESSKIAPPGYYMLFVVHKGVPSKAVWVRIE